MSPGQRPVLPDPIALGLALVVSPTAAAIGLHVFAIFGVVPAAELVILAVFGGLGVAPRLRAVLRPERQLVVQTAAAVAVVAATLGQTLTLGVAHAVGRQELAMLLLVGAGVAGAGALAAAAVLFDSALLPASAAWPSRRIVVADAIGRLLAAWRALSLGLGLMLGHWGAVSFGAPLLSAFGLAFLGNGLGLAVLAVGAIVRPLLPFLLRADVDALLLPHGLLLGAGLAGLCQAAGSLMRRSLPRAGAERVAAAPPAGSRIGRAWRSVRTHLVGQGVASRRLIIGLALASGLYALLAELLLAAAGLQAGGIDPFRVLALGLLAGLLTVGLQLLVGLSGAHLGWVPTLGCCLLALAVARWLGGPTAATLVLITLVAASGPAFAELAYQLTAAAELGAPRVRAQQVLAGLLGLASALAVVAAWAGDYFAAGYVPPVSQALATAVELAADRSRLSAAVPWVLVGFVAQWLGGPRRQVGFLFATGLLIAIPALGWALLAGLAARTVLSIVSRSRADLSAAIFGLGCIGGELLRPLLGR